MLAKPEDGKTGVFHERNPIHPDKPNAVYRLRRITDGYLVDVRDDGVDKSGTPKGDRQSLLRALGKRTADGLPVLFLDEPLKGEAARLGSVASDFSNVVIPVADERIKAAMAKAIEERQRIARDNDADYKARVRAAAAEQAFAESRGAQARAARNGGKRAEAD